MDFFKKFDFSVIFVFAVLSFVIFSIFSINLNLKEINHKMDNIQVIMLKALENGRQ